MDEQLTDEEKADVKRWEEELRSIPGPWAIYPNPMRSDGVFVAQNLPLIPYPGARHADGASVYPAVPHQAACLMHQIPYRLAKELVRRLNTKKENADD